MIRISASADRSGFIDVNVTTDDAYLRLWFSRRMGPIEGYPFPLSTPNRVYTVRSVTLQADALRAQSSPTLRYSAGCWDVDSVIVTLSTRLQSYDGFARNDVGDIVDSLENVRNGLKDAILADGFVRSYLETALWSSTMMPEDAEVSDVSYFSHGCDVDDCSLETVIGAKRDCDAFQNDYNGPLERSEYDIGRDAHDFWLSRNGHGAGFFDRGTDDGDTLQSAAKSYGEVNLYHMGDNEEMTIYSDADVDTLGTFDLETVWS